MSTSSGHTTAPCVASTLGTASRPPSVALIIAWSASQPHRVGEVAFFPFGERLFVGRGGAELETFAHFVRQSPGEVAAVDPHEEMLGGTSISRRQLQVRSMGDALEIEKFGRCPTFLNSHTELRTAAVRPGDTVLLKGELLLLCALRPNVLPPSPCQRGPHAFGEADAHGIVGQSPAAWALRAQLAAAAATPDHVLIQGESGTGKELAAAAIHRQSGRAKGPLISCNASALPSSLVSSELFGNLANYPNPGMQARKGLVGAADGGTLFFDEIGELPLDAQAQLLRVLDQGEYLPLGESIPRRVDIRVVAATHRDDSHFRGDLHARFSTRVRIPALRERREDIPLLLRHLLLQRARQCPEIGQRWLTKMPNGRLEPKVSARLVDGLVRHALPTNVRELRTILVRAIQVSDGDKLILPPEMSAAPSPTPSLLPEPSAPALAVRPRTGEPSKEDLQSHLQREGWNVARVARALDVSRAWLYRTMDDYGIEPDRQREVREHKVPAKPPAAQGAGDRRGRRRA